MRSMKAWWRDAIQKRGKEIKALPSLAMIVS
jgi:hypothetical protein